MTKFSLVSLFLFSALLSSAFSVPFNLLNEESTNGIGFTRETTCAKSCNLAPNSEQLIKFKVGNTYSYNVDLITEIDEQQLERSLQDTKEQQQVKIGAVADISVYGPCEFVLRLRKVHLTGIANHRQLAEQLETESLHFSYENGRIVDVCASGEDKPWTINVKKSILSALQMSAKDVTQKDTIIETDISGQCDTVYEPIETNRDQTNFIIRKVKQLNKCGQRHQSNIGFFPRSYPGLEQVIRSAMPLVDAAYECTQKIERNIVTRTECTDRQRLWPSTVEVRSMIELNLIEQHENEQTTKSMPTNFQRHRLAMSNVFFGSNNEFDQKQLAHHRHHHTHNYQNQQIRSIGYEQNRYSVEDVRQIVQLICPKVVDSVEIDVAQLFSQLVEAKHGLKSEDELRLFKQIQSRELCQSPKMVDLYLDASALTGTVGSVDVLIYAYQHGLVTGSRASYLFSLLSFVKHPSVEGAQKLVQFLKEHYNTESQYQQPQQKQLPRGVVLGISGYVHNLEQSQSHDQSLNEFVQQVVELFVQNLEHCTVQLEQQRSINAGPITVGQCLTYVNSLRNVGLSRSSSAVVDRLVKIVEQNPSAGDSNLNVEEVRIAVIRALLTGANDQIRHFLFEKVVKNTAESPELQIEAYKTIVMSGTSRTQLQEIKSYLEQIESTQNGRQLVNYVRSHQDNLRTTTDPHRQTVLPVDAPIFPKPSPQKYGYSRNYEFSYVHEGLNVGFTAEADLVFPSHHQQSRSLPVPVPHEFVFNLTVPVLGKEFQVVEVRVHQHGMEQVIARQLRDMERNTKEDLFTIARQMISTIVTDGADILSENPNIQLVLEISVDGKTLVVADQHDLVTDESDRNDILREIMDTLQKRVSIDRAFAFKPIDTVVQVPTLNGLPVQFRLNSSVVFGLKTELNFDARDLSNSVIEFEMFPSVSAQWESAVEFFTGSEHKSVESVSRLYAAPQLNWKLEAKEGRMLGVKIDLPKDRYTVARFESQLYTRNENGERVRINQRQRAVRDITNHYNYEQCSDLTKKPFGVAFCYDVEYANNGHNSADLVTEFYMVKVDRQLRSYELYAEMPFSIEQLFNARRGMTYRDLMRQEKASIKFAFNTPGSEIDREISVEIDLPTEGTANSEIEKSGRIRIQTPWKQIEAKALVRNQMKEKTIQAEVIVDQKQFFQAEIALEKLHRGQKTEYKPRLILKMASRINPIHMTGVVSYTQGPKTKLYIELEDAHKQITYIKCTVVKSGDENASAHLMVNLNGVEIDVSTLLERTDRTLNLQLDSQYRTPFRPNAEKATIVLKLQNFSNSKVLKFANIGELTMTQYPRYNFVYQHNLMLDNSQQLDHSLKLGWNGEEQIQSDQFVKWASLRGKFDLECKSKFVYRPMMIDYDVTSYAILTGFGVSGPKRYEITMLGRSQNENKDGDFKGEITYHHMSKSPLKMKMHAELKSNSIDFIYNDKIEEVTPNNFNGELSVQLSPEQRYDANYRYQMEKGENRQQQHELEFEFNNPITRFTAKHHGMLRLVPDQLFQLKSKLVANNVDLCDGEIKLTKEGPSHFEMNHYGQNMRTKLMLNPYSLPMAGNLEFENKRWKHDSMVEYSPAELLKFHSNTKRDNQHLLTIESEYSPKQTSRFMLNSKPFKGQLDYNLNEMPNEKLASWEFSMPDSWSHQSKLEIKPRDQKVMLQSLTRYQNYDLANLEAKYHPEDEHYFRLTTPMAQTDLYAQMHQRNNAQRKASLSMVAGKLNHESQLEIEPDNDFKFVSLTRNNGKKLANLKYQLLDNVHNIEFDSDDLLKAKAECNLAHETSKPYANIDFTLDNLEHKTKLMGERDTESLFVDSLTTKPREADRTIAEIKATITKKAGHKSFATVRIGDHIRSNIELEPYKSALVKFDCPHYIHKTELNYHPTENQQTKYWDLRSETTSAQTQDKYNFGISHRTNDKSFVKVAIPTFESELVYDHPENNLNNHQMVFDFEGNTNTVPYSHKSQVRLVRDNYQTNKPVFQVRTKTMHKLTGANMLELDGLYRHQDTELPSTFDLKLGRSVNGNIKLNPFHPTVKTLSLEGQMQDDRTGKFYTHQTKVELHPEALSIQSQTENNGQNVAMLNTFLTTDQDKMSHFELKGDHDDYYTKFELEPRNRRALLSLDVKPYQHKTELMRDIDNNNNNDDNLFTGYRLTSNTMKNRENLYSLDTIWNRMDRPSHLTMKSNGKFETEIRYRPEKRMAEFGLKTNTIQHNSHISLNRNRIARSIEQSPKQLYFKSNTIYRDSVLADIDAKLHGMDGDNVFNCDLPHFTLKSSLNVPERKTNLDFLSKTASRRHILGSVYLNKDNQIQDNKDQTFHADLAWDVDRNQDSRVMLELQVKQVLSAYSTNYPKLDVLLFLTNLQMQYGQNKLILDCEFMSDNVFSHPIRTSLAFVPLDNYRTAEAWELIYTHKTDAQSRFECELNYVEAEQIKYNAILNGQVTEQFVKFNGQTKVPHNLNLQVSFNLEAGIRERNNYYLVADASHAISNVYKTKFEIKQNEAEKRFDGKVEFKLPNVETQLVNFYVDLAERKVHLEIVNEVNENKFQLELNYDINLVHLTAVSNIPYFPLVDLKLKVVPLQELTAHIDLDGERKGELVITYTGSVYDLKYEFFGKLSSIVTPTLEVISTGNYEQSTAKLICKYNAEQVFVGQFKLDKAGLLDGKWLVEGLVSRHGGELARASLQAFSDQTQRKFSFEYEPTEPTLNQLIAPFSIVISGEQQPNQIEVVSIKLTRAQQQLFDLDLVLKYREQPLYYYQSRYYESIVRNIPEKVECVIRHYPTDRRVEFQVSLMEYLELNHNSQHSLLESHAKRPVTSKVRNQLLVNLNGRSVGFVLVTTNFDHQYTVEQNLLIHSPVNGRVLQYQTGYQLHQDYFLYLGQFKTDVRRPDPLYRYRLSLETDSESNYLINAELDSYKFRRSPKLVNVVVRKSTPLRPVDAKVQIDVGQSESDILTVESYVEEKRSNEIAYQHGLNTTAFLAVYTQDRLVDFSVNAHIAESGFGLILKNVNYRGERSEHFYQARFLDNQRFEIDLINPEHRFRVEGALKTNPRSESNLFVADFVVYQWYHDVEQRTQYRRSPITEQTLNADRVHKVHLEATGKCVRADIENVKFTDEIRQINACFDLDNANIVNVAVDTIRNGEKVADLNVRLDTRSAGNALKLYLHWNPEYARQIVQYLTNKYNDGEQYDNEFISHELLREFQHKYSILVEKLSNELLNEPFVKIILEEIVPILNELGVDLPQIEKFIRLYLIEFVEYVREYYQTVVYRFDQIFVQSWLQPFVRSVTLVGYRAQEVCKQNVFCHSVSNVLSTWTDSESLSNYLVEQLLTTVQHAHRFVATSRNGYWLRDYLPNLTFPQTITRYTKHTLATIWNYVRDSFESTTPLRKLFHHIETCYYEFVNSSALGSVNWQRIREALRQTVELVCSPSTWYSSGRFVIYDPQNGDLQIELRSPLVQKTRAYADKYYYNHLNQSTITPTRGSYQPLYSNRYGQGPRVSSMRAGTYGNLYRGLFE